MNENDQHNPDADLEFSLRQAALHGPVLDTPEPPAGTRWEDVEDFRASALLKANGIPLTGKALLASLGCQDGVLKSAAAHTLGQLGHTGAIAALRRLADTSDDLPQVEAAYALVRMGQSDGRSKLIARLKDPVRAYLGPIVAAGYLAILGDPVGYPVVASCFDEDNLIVRVVGSKQSIYFVRFHGKSGVDGAPIDAYGLFDRSLRDPHPDVQWSALVQLRQLRTPEARKLLETYVSNAADARMEAEARRMLTLFP